LTRGSDAGGCPPTVEEKRMTKETPDHPQAKPDIMIDYDNVDVAQIMDQIKIRVAGPVGDEPSGGGASESAGVPDFDLERGDGPATGRGRVRRILLKVMTPFRPLIKLLMLPVYDEFQQTVRILHNANRRLDRLYEATDRDREAVRVRLQRDKEYIKLLHGLSHNLVVELTKLKIENDTLKARLEIMERDADFLGKRERALEREVLK
jgi:hypothetical protein